MLVHISLGGTCDGTIMNVVQEPAAVLEELLLDATVREKVTKGIDAVQVSRLSLPVETEMGLVRFHGIVRDMKDREFVAVKDKYISRTPLVCSAIPGETRWSMGEENVERRAANANETILVNVYGDDADTVGVCDLRCFYGYVTEGSMECLMVKPLPSPDKMELSSAVRDEVVAHLTTAVFEGDADLAQLFTTYLVSIIESRNVTEPMVGKLSLNIYGADRERMACLLERMSLFMQSVVPRVKQIDLSINALNQASYSSAKNFDTDAIDVGELMLGTDTHLVVNETTLETGKLVETGLRNVQALSDLIGTQAVEIDFTYQKVTIPVNAPTCIVSEGKSLIPCDWSVRWNHGNGEPSSRVTEEPSEAQLAVWRSWLAHAKNLELSLPKDVADTIADSLVSEMQSKESETDMMKRHDKMHALVNVSRLVARTSLHASVRLQDWDAARLLVRAITQRD